jgi:hypothetical protein
VAGVMLVDAASAVRVSGEARRREAARRYGYAERSGWS